MLLNFISNAIKFTNEGTFVEVILSANKLNLPIDKNSNAISKNLNENMIRAVEDFSRR